MNRMLTVAAREYAAYAKTFGFWLSLLTFPLFAVVGGALPALTRNAETTPTVVIVDVTGSDRATDLRRAMDVQAERSRLLALRQAASLEGGIAGVEAVRQAGERGGYAAAMAELKRVAPRTAAGLPEPKPDVIVLDTPADLQGVADLTAAEAAVRPYLTGARSPAPGHEKLRAAAILTREDGRIALRLWSDRNVPADLEGDLRAALRDVARAERLEQAGVDPGLVAELDAVQPSLQSFSLAAEGRAMGVRDRLPGLIGFVAGMILWSAVITGASILMNSVIEEKSSRVLEVLLSSATPFEVLGGKVLGVAALSLTVLGGWGVVGSLLFTQVAPGLVAEFAGVLEPATLLWLALYFLGGYVMYATLFAGIGAFCETPRDAQTLLGPVMLALFVPIFVASMAIRNPELELLRILSWVPPFTPFLMSVRVTNDPPLWEILGTLAAMAAFAALIAWLSGKAFRAGALSNIKLDWKGLGALLTGKAG
jgi:ABC-2 type transport system permease protein